MKMAELYPLTVYPYNLKIGRVRDQSINKNL